MKELVKPDARKMIGENELGTEGGKLFMNWMLRDKIDPLHAFMQAYTANGGHAHNMAYHLQTLYKLWLRTPEIPQSGHRLLPRIPGARILPRAD